MIESESNDAGAVAQTAAAESVEPKPSRAAKPAPDAAKSSAPEKKIISGKAVLGKGLAALKAVNPYSKSNLEAMMASAQAAGKGAGAVGAEYFAFSKQNIEQSVAAMKTLAGAKSLQDVVELQGAFAKQMIESYVSQTREMSSLLSRSLKTTVAPLSERYTTIVGQLKV